MSDLRTLTTAEFPSLLQEIPDAPKQLYARGTLPSSEAPLLAIVGSRKCTSYGKDAVSFLVEGLRGSGISIVSGLALGIDAHAHTAALEAGLHTIAVPGSGLDDNVLYPRTHLSLAQRILDNGGALLSEFAPEQQAAPWTFPQRNRIMAGMSHAILIIEAAERSGTLITARLATEYNRELLVVPGSIFASSSKGAHQFLKLGATPVTTPDDILNVFNITPTQTKTAAHNLSVHEQEIYDALEQPMSKDELLETLSCSTTEAHIALSKLELDGVIVERLGMLRRTK